MCAESMHQLMCDERERDLHPHFRVQQPAVSKRDRQVVTNIHSVVLNLNSSPRVRLSTLSFTVTLWGI